MPSASPSSSADAAPGFSISTDSAKLDVAWIVHSVLGAYWGGWLSAGQIRQALHGSLCFGAYADGKQIGFIRAVTDGAIFSSLVDVIVAEEWRGKGVGTALLKAAVEHPSIAGTICILKSRPDNQLWYFARGFRLVDRTSGLMQREPT